MTAFKEEPNSFDGSYKFVRRKEISSEERFRIAVMVLLFKYHGQVTQLSKTYSSSRTFIYDLRDLLSAQLEGLFEAEPLVRQGLSKRETAQEVILNLRLIGKCSLSTISELLDKVDSDLPHSTCFISQFLNDLGSKVGKIVKWRGECHYASDEIYMVGNKPVLVTVDPISSTILQIEELPSLTKVGWLTHWKNLEEAGLTPLSLVKDQGKAMDAAQREWKVDLKTQADTFHAVSHRLGTIAHSLERTFEKAFAHEWEREEVAQKAVKPLIIAKKKALHKEACQQSIFAIERYENFKFLYGCILQQFNTFDHQGNARKADFAKGEVETALNWMKELAIPKLNEAIAHIENLLDGLFNFLDKAQIIQYKLEVELGDIPTYFWIYAWQNDKKSRKIKDYKKSQGLAENARIALGLLMEHYQKEPEQFEETKRAVFRELDSIVQSSAMVETINSLLRPYMNGARNQLSQDQLNLIRFYLNHRAYKRGKRKGFSPIELLTGERLTKSPIEILMDIDREQ